MIAEGTVADGSKQHHSKEEDENQEEVPAACLRTIEIGPSGRHPSKLSSPKMAAILESTGTSARIASCAHLPST